MSRVKRGTTAKARTKKILKAAKGFWGRRKNVKRRAKETLLRSGQYAYIGRKQRKRDFRSLFVARTNAAARLCGTKYSDLIKNLTSLGSCLNRKMLSQVSLFDFAGFKDICRACEAA